MSDLGIFSKALEYGKRSLEIIKKQNDRVWVAASYTSVGVLLQNMGRYQEALESHKKALKIHKELNDRVGLAQDYYNISFVLVNTSKYETLKSLYNALRILKGFEKQNGYHHPLMDRVNDRISHVKEYH